MHIIINQVLYKLNTNTCTTCAINQQFCTIFWKPNKFFLPNTLVKSISLASGAEQTSGEQVLGPEHQNMGAGWEWALRFWLKRNVGWMAARRSESRGDWWRHGDRGTRRDNSVCVRAERHPWKPASSFEKCWPVITERSVSFRVAFERSELLRVLQVLTLLMCVQGAAGLLRLLCRAPYS